jgi:3-oxoacyl-[acyl-carrier protein] reductase
MLTGLKLVLTYNSNKTAAEGVVASLQKLGVKVITVQADASSAAFGEGLVNTTLKSFPNRKIDIIVNNAGHATFQDTTSNALEDDFDLLFHANVRGPHLLIKAALPHLQSPGGRIINIGSVVSRTGTKYAAFYSSSKAALNTLSLAWAEELGEKGITVNVVSPGPIDTDYAHQKRVRSRRNSGPNSTSSEMELVLRSLVPSCLLQAQEQATSLVRCWPLTSAYHIHRIIVTRLSIY